jgi:co-chaperonin GroES (HSP10)
METMTIRPLRQVLWTVEVPFDPNLTWGGSIFIHETARTMADWTHRKLMRVVAVGRDCDPDVAVGSYVIIDDMMGVQVRGLKGGPHYLVYDRDVLATVDGIDDNARIF